MKKEKTWKSDSGVFLSFIYISVRVFDSSYSETSPTGFAVYGYYGKINVRD